MRSPITTVPLFKSKTITAGTFGLSDVIDVRDIADQGRFSLSYTVAGTSGAAGTTTFTYLGCTTKDGTFVAPGASSAIGTSGTGGTSDIRSFTPVLSPFMKIKAACGTSADSVVTAELYVQ